MKGGSIVELILEYRTIQCNCGLCYAIPEKWALEREKDHRSFYCPNCKKGHYYPQESTEEKYRRLYEQKERCCIEAHKKAAHIERRFWGLQGHVAKLKKANGDAWRKKEGV